MAPELYIILYRNGIKLYNSLYFYITIFVFCIFFIIFAITKCDFALLENYKY